MISIIIPIYNAGEKLKRMLSSIQQQSYSNYEVLLIDDGSTDQTGEICRTAAAADERIKYYFQENAGVSVARNHGLQKANGEFVVFLDADDRIDKNYLQVLKDACTNTDIAVCDVVCEDENGNEKRRFTLKSQVLNQKEALDYLLKREGINSGPCAKMFRESMIEDMKFPLLKAYEDILFVVEAFYKADRIAVIDSTAYHYIQNEQGAMSNFIKTPSYDIVVATEQLMKRIVEDDRLEDECMYITLSHAFQYVIPLLSESDSHAEFIDGVQALFRKYFKKIIKNRAFPWKEKITYGLFCFGWTYQDRKLRRVN